MHRSMTDGWRTVGVIGGMGPAATVAFLGELVAATPARRDQDHLHVIVDSDPGIPDRTAFLLGRGPDPRPALIRTAARLATAGAEFLVMPCNTASAFAPEVAASVGLLVVDWIGVTIQQVVGLEARAIGLLATTGTINAGLYARALSDVGLEAIVPADADQATVMDVVYGPHGVKAGSIDGASASRLVSVAEHLVERGADTILLGCTELPLVLPATDRRWPSRAVDPAVAVAREVVRLARHRAGDTGPSALKHGEATDRRR
jgi:aspartate racemase